MIEMILFLTKKRLYRIGVFFLGSVLLFLNASQQSYALDIVQRKHQKILGYEDKFQIIPMAIDGADSGHFVIMSRENEKIKAKYFADGNVHKKFLEWSKEKKIILICSGAFADSNGKPIGVSVDNGSIVNRVRDTVMDGLVIVEATGGIRVSDLKYEKLTIGAGSSERILQLSNYQHMNAMLDWAEKERATVFQTQLLAAKDSLRLTPNRATKQRRERRLLLLATNKSNNQLEHWVVNVHKNVYLGDIAKAVLDSVIGDGRYVHSMLNLDTGDYDILKVFIDGKERKDVIGRQDLSKATNLLVYYHE